MLSLAELLPIFQKLTDVQQEMLCRAAAYREVKKGTVIHSDNRECTGLLLVSSGQLRAYSLSSDGHEITLYRLFERDLCLFSASCMLNSIQFDITVEAVKDSGFWIISADVYKMLMEESTAAANYTNEIMASRFSDVMWLIDQIMWKSFDKRLAAFLIEESAIDNSLILKTTHETIGNHLGNPREVVTRMLRYFQSEGLIKLSRGTIEISDYKRLQHMAEE